VTVDDKPKKTEKETPDKASGKTEWEAYKKSVKPLKKSRKKPGLDLQKKIEITIQDRAPKPPNFGTSAEDLSSASLLYRNPKKIRRTTEIQARLDLHGMTQAQAVQALTSFIQRCYTNHQQDILVITGKGVQPLDRHEAFGEEEQKKIGGVLRRNLPAWLEHPTLRPYIHFYTFSHPFEGKTGACYVRLKKS